MTFTRRIISVYKNNVGDIYLLIPVLGSVVFAWNWVLPADDALITHRYVNHFLEHGEPYFNSGDRVLGLSAPGYYLLLTGLSTLFPLEIAYKFIASIAYVFTAVIMYKLLPVSYWPNKLLVSVIFSSNIYYTYWVFSGMETFFIPLLAMISLWGVMKKSIVVLVIAFGVAVIFRPEAWIGIFPLVATAVIIDRRTSYLSEWQLTKRSVIGSIGFVFGIYIAMATFILHYYDNFIPSSILAKTLNRRLPDIDRIEGFAASFIGPINIPIPFGYILGVAVMVVAFAAVLYSCYKRRSFRLELILFVGLVTFSLYLLLTGASIWGWYYVFVTYVTMYFLLSASLIAIRKYGLWSYAPLIVLVILALWSGIDYGNRRNDRIVSVYVEQMQEAAKFIEQRYETQQSVIVGSSGYFGAVAENMKVIDSVGLFSPEFVRARSENMDLRMTDVIDWDLIVCSKGDENCLNISASEHVLGSVGNLWIIENLK